MFSDEKLKTIVIQWCIDDIRQAMDDIDMSQNELTDEDCFEILKRILNNHDANIGINWDVLCGAIKDYKEGK